MTILAELINLTIIFVLIYLGFFLALNTSNPNLRGGNCL